MFHHVLLRAVSDNSMHILQHREKYRLHDIQILLRLDVLVWVLSIKATKRHQRLVYNFSTSLQHFSLDEQDSVQARMLDRLLDVSSLHRKVPRMLCDPGFLGRLVKWMETIRRGMPDDGK